ncbi:MAG: hypothetical protein BMS9Abin05_1174 [Rhodothermia bacterium]|nr:MAG: hypothetical protein BMS9Abin05_1174 [Rhodothermia bacterium]
MRNRPTKPARVGWRGFLLAYAGLWILMSGVGSVSAQTIVGGKASGVWTLDGSPYLFAGFVVVQDESVLQIEQGVELQLLGKGLYVGYQSPGELQADGIRILGPGSVEFFDTQGVAGIGPGWIRNSSLENVTAITIHPGANPLLQNNVGTGVIGLPEGPIVVTQEWILQPRAIPYEINDTIVVESGGSLIFEDLSLVGSGSITFLPSDGPVSRLSRVNFTDGPDIIVYPGAKLVLEDPVGLAYLRLPDAEITKPGDYVLEDFGIPYVLNGVMSIAPEVGLRVEGISFQSGTILHFRGPDENTSVEEVRPSYLIGSTFAEATQVRIEIGSNLSLEQSVGLDAVTLISGQQVAPFDWTLPIYERPLRIDGTLTVEPNSGLTVEGNTFIGGGRIVVSGPNNDVSPDQVRTTRIANTEFAGTTKVVLAPGSRAEIENNLGLDRIFFTSSTVDIPFDWNMPDFGLPYQLDGVVEIAPTQSIWINGMTFLPGGRLIFQGPNGIVPAEQVRESTFSNNTVPEGVDVGFQLGAKLSIQNNDGLDHLLWVSGSESARGNWTLPDYGFPIVVKDFIGINYGNRVTISSTPELRMEASATSIGTINVGYRNEATLEILNANISGGGRIHYGRYARGSVTNSVLTETNVSLSSKIEVTGNIFLGLETAILIQVNGLPSIHGNDFIETSIALKNFSGTIVDVTNNYWGHPSGPSLAGNPNGLGGRIIGAVIYSPWSLTPFTVPINAEQESPRVYDVELSPGYPNPFNGQSTLTFSLRQTGPARLTVYDMLGRRVRELFDKTMPSGWHRATISSEFLSPGSYLVVLETAETSRSRIVTFIR